MIAASRLHRRLAVAVTAVSGGAMLAAVTAVVGPAGASTAQPWVMPRSACATPVSASAIRCYAEKLVTVRAHTPGARPHSAATSGDGPGGGLSPANLATFYGYNRSTALSRTVGVVMWGNDPHVRTDLNTFNKHYGMPAETSRSFRVVNQRGASSPLPATDTDTAAEIALDTQAIRAVCAHCRILLVEANIDAKGNPSNASLAAAENTAVRLGASVVSNSWGGPEATANPTLKKAFLHRGVVITAANGDDGWDGWDFAAYGQSADGMPSFPAVSPYVVAVGGTTITRTAKGTRANEVVWNSDGQADPPSDPQMGGATGGGCSTSQPAPAWQQHTPYYSAAGCHGTRSGADISVDGDPATGVAIYNSYGGGWGRYGGTSLSAPIVAGMYALAGGSGGSSYPAASLYANANTLKRTSSLFDVVRGGNSFCGGGSTRVCSAAVQLHTGPLELGGTNNPNGAFSGNVVDCSFPRNGANVSAVPAPSRQCNAATGFDGPSGLGAPRGLGLFHDTSPGAAIISPSSIRHAKAARFHANLKPIKAAKIVAVLWSWGDGSKESTGATPAHTFTKAGTYTIAMAARDSLHQVVLRKIGVKVT